MVGCVPWFKLVFRGALRGGPADASFPSLEEFRLPPCATFPSSAVYSIAAAVLPAQWEVESVSREVDEAALDVGVEQFHADAVAYVETLEPALQLPFDRWLEEPHPGALRGRAGDEGVE